ncbi:MAG: VWA domain-containing protein [Acidobacteriia bacterium]|nr:VWA domain-containing protein [Terriglobia bacterium]
MTAAKNNFKRRLVAGLFPFVFLAFFPCISARAQDQGNDQGSGAIRVNVNLVDLDATVKTKDGRIMDGLKKEDFEVREDGVAKKIELFSRDELPLRVALVLDLSDSIEPFLGPLRDAATTTLSALKPEDEVALFTFSTEAQLNLPLTLDKTKIADQIGSFRTGGATNINDGIFVASEYLLKNAPKGRRVIILISDDVGTDAGGQGTRDIVTETLAADASVYNLKIPGYNPPGTLFYAGMIPGLVDIRKVTDQTGGEIFDVHDVGSLDAVFQALIHRIKTRYTLGYYTTANGAEGKPHKLEVRLSPSFGKKGRDYTILAKTSYYFR